MQQMEPEEYDRRGGSGAHKPYGNYNDRGGNHHGDTTKEFDKRYARDPELSDPTYQGNNHHPQGGPASATDPASSGGSTIGRWIGGLTGVLNMVPDMLLVEQDDGRSSADYRSAAKHARRDTGSTSVRQHGAGNYDINYQHGAVNRPDVTGTGGNYQTGDIPGTHRGGYEASGAVGRVTGFDAGGASHWQDEPTKSTSAASTVLKVKDDECPICMDVFTNPQTLSCSHRFCKNCLDQVIKTAKSHLCPTCRTPFKTAEGKQPKGGTMTTMKFRTHLPGYDRCGTLSIQYSIPSGIQGVSHAMVSLLNDIINIRLILCSIT